MDRTQQSHQVMLHQNEQLWQLILQHVLRNLTRKKGKTRNEGVYTKIN